MARYRRLHRPDRTARSSAVKASDSIVVQFPHPDHESVPKRSEQRDNALSSEQSAHRLHRGAFREDLGREYSFVDAQMIPKQALEQRAQIDRRLEIAAVMEGGRLEAARPAGSVPA
jgi:hypothetical protein